MLDTPVRCGEPARGRFERILVGFDGARAAHQALRVAVHLATATSGEVVVLIVIANEAQGGSEQRQTADAEAAPLRAAPDGVQWSRSCNRVRYTVRVVPGERPEQVLSDHLLQHGYDVLIIGRHGKEHSGEGGLGLVAHELAARSTFPLLLVGE